jgi:hypothetical protein
LSGGGRTREQWRALERSQRSVLIKRAQADLLGSFRYCANKRCRHYRSCAAANPGACAERLWLRLKVRPKPLGRAYARLENLNYEL